MKNKTVFVVMIKPVGGKELSHLEIVFANKSVLTNWIEKKTLTWDKSFQIININGLQQSVITNRFNPSEQIFYREMPVIE